MSPTTPSPSTPLRILLLHGYTQSPPLFHAKTRALHKALLRQFPSPRYTLLLTYAPAPHKLPLADIPGHPPLTPDSPAEEAPEAYGWWRRKDSAPDGRVVYEGLEKGMEAIARCIREEGPFEGVVGFSQGAAAAAMVASLLEGATRLEAFRRAEGKGGMEFPSSFLAGDGEGEGFVQGPLKFAVCYGGFRAPGELYRGFYEPEIRTRVLHVLGQVDVVVDEVRGRELVRVCEGGEGNVVVHPGGHFVPSQKPWLDAVVGFVKECVEGSDGRREEKEVSVEDMDVPF